MLKTIEAVLENDGRLRLLEDIDSPKEGVRFLVTVLPPDLVNGPYRPPVLVEGEVEDMARASERVLRKLWDEEDEDHGWTGL